MASKFVKKQIWNSNASLFLFQNIYRMNKRHCPSLLDTKQKSTRFAGTSINLYDRLANYSHGAKQRSLLPHVLQSLVLFVEETQMKMKISLNLEYARM